MFSVEGEGAAHCIVAESIGSSEWRSEKVWTCQQEGVWTVLELYQAARDVEQA